MSLRERLRDPAWDDPLIVSVSALLALLVMATGAPPELRVPITLWFFLTGPGLALIPLLGLDDFKWVGVIAASLTVDVVITELMLYTGVWSLSVGVVVILIICAIGVGLQVYRLETADIGLLSEMPRVNEEAELQAAIREEREVPDPSDNGEPSVSVTASDEPKVRFDLNRASAAELQLLNGIGPRLAARIIKYREANGPFNSAEDLTRVRGIGEAHLAVIVKAVTVL